MLGSVYAQPKLTCRLAAFGLFGLLCACSREVDSKTHVPANAAVAVNTAPASAPRESALAARDAEFAKTVKPFVTNYCVDCHDADIFKGKLDLAALGDGASLEQHRETWEKVFAKLRHGEMPPKDEPRPPPEVARALVQWLAAEFKRQDDAAPVHVGRAVPRRLNRSEYNNTVRDLLGVNFTPADDFPPDDSGYGFDNNGDVLSLSPLLMEKYLKAAEKVARTAVFGVEPLKPSSYTHQPWYIDFDTSRTIPKAYDETGLSMPYSLHVMHRFPVEAEYELTAINRGFMPPGADPRTLAFWINGKRVHEANVQGRSDGEINGIYAKFRTRLPAGQHWLAVSIVKMYERLPPSYGGPNPNESPNPARRSPREHFISNLVVHGPFDQTKGASAASLEKLYRGNPPGKNVTPERAHAMVADLARRAYRRPVTKPEVDELLRFVELAQKDGEPFEEGLAFALTRMLVSPQFLFRMERNPPPEATGPVPLSPHELATRLSYFLWSSMPDDELMRLADENKLAEPAVLEAQVRRMLQDPKAFALVENFGGQWLQFRALESHTVERKAFQHFTEYTKLSMQRETEKFFEHIMREDRSVLEFVTADYSFLNQRLADYYGIPGVEGPEFRKVTLPPESRRRGVLTHASVLTVSSYSNRTSPVLRGKYILENILNSAPPPPPPDVPSLEDDVAGVSKSLRESLEAHRAKPVCASCHVRMDPLGFGLENFDPVGRWREKAGKFDIDASGALPDGRTFSGPMELSAILATDQEDFVECITDKLLTYALGRGLTISDRASVRRIAAQVAASDHRFSSLVLGIVNSPQFHLRAPPAPVDPKS